jgi:hypothetical protein
VNQSRVGLCGGRSRSPAILPRLYPDQALPTRAPGPPGQPAYGGATPGQGQAPSGRGRSPALDLGPRPPQTPRDEGGPGGKMPGGSGGPKPGPIGTSISIAPSLPIACNHGIFGFAPFDDTLSGLSGPNKRPKGRQGVGQADRQRAAYCLPKRPTYEQAKSKDS